MELNSGTADINADVLGMGSWDVYNGALTMEQPVGPFQSFFIGYNAVLVIGDAPYFAGGSTAELSDASVQLPDLTATSYSYVNNIISFFNSAGTDIGQYHLTNSTYPAGSPFGVYPFGHGVVITGQNIGATPLPVHT
jgi:hypothetical protein